MKKITEQDFPLSQETMENIVAYVSEKKEDVCFLDRALIMQFKNLPDSKVISIESYVADLMTAFYVSLYNYYYDLSQSDTTENTESAV